MAENEVSIAKLIRLLKDDKLVFLTGAAGTGKSHLVRRLINSLHNPIVLGTTGIAANNIKGDTVHSFFKLGISKNIAEMVAYTNTQIERITKSCHCDEVKAEWIFFKQMNDALREADCIIIDEVSMMSEKLYTMIVHRLKQAGAYRQVPILFVGDMYQLPPVSKDDIQKYIFTHPDWQDITILNLSKIRRTDNIEWAEIQQKLRIGKVDRMCLDFIEAHSETKKPINENDTYLMSTNDEVDKHNQTMLERLKEAKRYVTRPVVKFKDQSVTDKQVEQFISDNNISKDLIFKIGSKIMFIANNKELGYFNGEIGVITGIGEDKAILVNSLVKPNVSYRIEKILFEKNKIKVRGNKVLMETVIQVMAMPFRLGYAITIHKSQGMTLSEGVIDCRGIFTPQQFYVGVSRVSNPDKLVILNFNKSKHISENLDVDNFYKKSKLIDESELYGDDEQESVSEMLTRAARAFDAVTLDELKII